LEGVVRCIIVDDNELFIEAAPDLLRRRADGHRRHGEQC
jgi:hypothetical protein